MKTTLARLLGVLLIVVLVAAACGDDDDATTTAGGDAAGAEDTMSDSDMSDSDMSDGDMSDTDMAEGDMAEDEMAMSDADDGDSHDHGHEHSHDQVLEVPEGMAVPEITIEVLEDPKMGHNLHVELTNFTIAPERASTDPVDGEGHMHVYVNGEKTGRLYNEWMHLSLPPGEHMVEVEVSANNHSPYGVDGEPIRAMAMVTVGEPAGGHSHGDEVLSVDAATAPSLSVEVVEDPKSGWNLRATVEDFTFAPENASTDHVDGEGHMHLYVDGEKITRLYGEWWHIAALTEGDHEVMVELSANDHRPYTVDGEPIVATATVTVSADRATPAGELEMLGDGGHGHSHGEDSHGDMEMGEEAGAGMDMADVEADVVIPVAFEGGEVTVEDDRIEVARDSVVAFSITSDVPEHVHVHGFDLFADVTPGETAMLVFTADVPGVFEVEFEDSFTFITEIEVR